MSGLWQDSHTRVGLIVWDATRPAAPGCRLPRDLNRMYVIVLSARREEQHHTWQCNLPLVDAWHMLKANAAVQVSQTMSCCTSMGSRS